MKKILGLILLILIVLISCDVSGYVSGGYDYTAIVFYPDNIYGYVSRQTYDVDGRQLSTTNGYKTENGRFTYTWNNCPHNYLRVEMRIRFYNSQGVGVGTEEYTFVLTPMDNHQHKYFIIFNEPE